MFSSEWENALLVYRLKPSDSIHDRFPVSNHLPKWLKCFLIRQGFLPLLISSNDCNAMTVGKNAWICINYLMQALFWHFALTAATLKKWKFKYGSLTFLWYSVEKNNKNAEYSLYISQHVLPGSVLHAASPINKTVTCFTEGHKLDGTKHAGHLNQSLTHCCITETRTADYVYIQLMCCPHILTIHLGWSFVFIWENEHFDIVNSMHHLISL